MVSYTIGRSAPDVHAKWGCLQRISPGGDLSPTLLHVTPWGELRIRLHEGSHGCGERAGHGMWIAVGKGKGGAGCTTAVLELAYAAARRRRGRRPRRVGVIDLDPQGNATDVLEPESRSLGIKDVLNPHSPLSLRDVLVPASWERILVAPADRFLANREVDITARGITALRRARLSGEIDDLVDDVIIDLPRDVGKLAATGLLGAETLFIAAQATMWGAQGAEEMRYTAERISAKGNPDLRIAGFIISAYDDARDSKRVLNEMKENFGEKVILPPIPRRVRVREAIESYHTPCREYGGEDLVEVSDIYQSVYDRSQEARENLK
ncbi:ParA family protein [Streptomyces sp. NPDC056987]|uniref:ParA family protein n=1 Tax=Streptomyces sp. NPDC056987 TaxID=3345988 RepID=UPI00362854FE